MKAGKSINRPVLARRLELDKRRRDYKIHLQTLKDQKCGTDFSHPPVVFRIQTVQKNANIKRKERQRYENICIEKINESYANKVINSKSFRDPYLIEQMNNSRSRKASPASSQRISPHSKSSAFQSARSVKSTSSDPNKKNENLPDNNKYSNCSPRYRINSKKKTYVIPHYELPPNFLGKDTSTEEEEENKNQAVVVKDGFHFEYNEIAQNESIPKVETEEKNTNNEEVFEVHPPEEPPSQKLPSPVEEEPQEQNFEDI